jgi:hypothetical protein
MAYREVGGGEFLRWEDEGTVVEGIWRGTSPWHKYDSRIGKLEVDGKEVVFSYTKVLAQRLDDVRIGSKVKIKYTGKDTTKDGTSFKMFRVLVDDEGVTGLTDIQSRSAAPPKEQEKEQGTDDGFGPEPPPQQSQDFKSTDDDVPF